MSLFTRMTDLATCLCAQISEDGSPETCFCGVIPGDAAVADYAGNCATKCGMAWVRLVNMMPMSGVGIPNEQPGNCGSELGATLELGILRCIGVGDDMQSAPSDTEYLRASEQQMKDAMTMYRAIVCCDAFSSKDILVNGYVPTGPLGGLVGGTWQVTVI